MKFTRFLGFAAISALIFSFCTNSFAQDNPGYATVIRLSGEARYSADGVTWHPLMVGNSLKAGNVIETSTGGSLDLVLGKRVTARAPDNVNQASPTAYDSSGAPRIYRSTQPQNIIHMNSGTVLAIDKLTIGDTGVDAVSDTELDLRQGSLFGNVKKLSASSEYLIKMPGGVAGIRGTTFALSANGDITVISGSVVISHTNHQGQLITVVLSTGDSFDPFTGQIVPLTPQQFTRVKERALATFSIPPGTTFTVGPPGDQTTIFISSGAGT